MSGSLAYTEIGKGTFGIIFQDAHDANRVVKRTLRPNINPRNWLPQEIKWHDRICSAFTTLNEHSNFETAHISQFHGASELSDQDMFPWLDASATLKDPEYRNVKSVVLKAQRIPATPMCVRQKVLEKLLGYTGDLVNATLSTAQNQNCLLRIYYGRDEPERARRLRLNPSLRNFPLGRTKLAACLDEADYKRLLKMLASTLASLHWYVGCDGRDTEFVLADLDVDKKESSPLRVFGHPMAAWLLDFNQVQAISMDMDGVRNAASAFMDNDPYYPKPGRDIEDWNVFRKAYLAAIAEYKADSDLPGLFCDAVEQLHQAGTER